MSLFTKTPVGAGTRLSPSPMLLSRDPALSPLWLLASQWVQPEIPMQHSIADLQHVVLRSISGERYTHLITLNPNRHVSPAVLPSLLRLWALDAVSRLFRGSITRTPHSEDLFSFCAFLEFAPQTGRAHYHLLARLHPSAHSRIGQVGPLRWRNILPGGQCDVRPILGTPEDRERVKCYVTKTVNEPRCFDGLRWSRELDLPQFCHTSTGKFGTRHRGRHG
jgi:hypothetical protein